MDKSDLGKRMKTFYEGISQTKLLRKCPVAIRIDGKAFHTFTKHMKRPFDEILIATMQETTKYLCENIQGCILGYTQSDEITLILVDYKKLDSDAWFNYEVQKVCSIAASMATMAFNREFNHQINKYREDRIGLRMAGKWSSYNDNYYQTLCKARDKGAMFDARCFNIPKEEVTNLIYWRQLDASRNSVQMVGQAYFSHKELQNKNCSQIQDMLMLEKDVNWNNYPVHQKRGTCVIKGDDGWYVDNDIPIFKGEGRDYIDKLVYCEEE